MCGIAGIVAARGATADREALERMARALTHRGPDEQVVAPLGRAGFGFCRLSIIDVAGGSQPIVNEDGTARIVLNGEIYNHVELRRELEARGHRFRTRSDVEVALHGYEEWGDDVPARLRGMFALALWDERRQRLLLARDRLGKKPLVYFAGRDGFAFASELRALVEATFVPRAVDRAAVDAYLTWQYVPAPLTAFAGVRKLRPGHVLVVEDGRLEERPYWRPRLEPDESITEEDAAAEVRRLLADAVKVRLMSEVPLGAFLSGGVDSSAVVALMAGHGPVRTFSVGFEEEGFSELPYARRVAERYGTTHTELVVEARAAEVLPRIVEHYGEPFGDSSALPTWHLAEATAAHVTVALNGDGGDELFAGYDRYALQERTWRVQAWPGARAVAGATAAAAAGVDRRAARYLRRLASDDAESYARGVSLFDPEEKQALYTEEMRRAVAGANVYAALRDAFDRPAHGDRLSRALYADTLTYLPDDLLVKVDIATMAHGLEGRSPLLDQHLVEFALRLPSRLKRRGARGKLVLKRAVADLVPREILERPKMGFGIPVSRWLRGELRPLLEETLFSGAARERGLLDPAAVRALADAHASGRADHGPRLWLLLMLELWAARFLG
jgi:asparagine synthase (glutamine-hydrolysing)